MFRTTVLLLFFFVCSTSAFAQISAIRLPDEDWRVAAKRSLGGIKRNALSAFDISKPLDETDQSRLWRFNGDKNKLVSLFKQTRDWRFLDDPEIQGFKRRLSWLYPDDGCFMRAEWLARLLNSHYYRSWVNKIFVFGSLKVSTVNHPSGFVSWWYHVVGGMKFGEKIVVFDPALNPEGPLEIKQWLGMMSKVPNHLKVAICNSGTFSPHDPCATSATHVSDPDLITYSSRYLKLERQRITALGRNADQELGDHPPWESR